MNKPETPRNPSQAYKEALRATMLASRSKKTQMLLDRLLVSQDEAAHMLGISRRTLITEIEQGRLRYVLVGKRRKFKPDDLAAYIDRQGRGGTESGEVLSFPRSRRQ
jgi:excisionase family DNA binding protein